MNNTPTDESKLITWAPITATEAKILIEQPHPLPGYLIFISSIAAYIFGALILVLSNSKNINICSIVPISKNRCLDLQEYDGISGYFHASSLAIFILTGAAYGAWIAYRFFSLCRKSALQPVVPLHQLLKTFLVTAVFLWAAWGHFSFDIDISSTGLSGLRFYVLWPTFPLMNAGFSIAFGIVAGNVIISTFRLIILILSSKWW